jgi:hypothetical protein
LRELSGKVSAKGNLTVEQWDTWVLKPVPEAKVQYDRIQAEMDRLAKLQSDCGEKLQALKKKYGVLFREIYTRRGSGLERIVKEEDRLREFLSDESGSDSTA